MSCKISVFEILVVIITISTIIIYILTQVRSPKIDINDPDINFVDVNILFGNASNGDLIFFCGDTGCERAMRWFTGSIFSHVGLLFKEINEAGENITYIFESDIGQKSKDGPRIIRLDQKLDNYKGLRYIGWRKLMGQRPTTKNILQYVIQYSDYKQDKRMMSWFFPFLKYQITKEKRVFCSELIVEVFKQENILNKTKESWTYSPGNLFENIVIGLNHNYNFSEGLFLKF